MVREVGKMIDAQVRAEGVRDTAAQIAECTVCGPLAVVAGRDFFAFARAHLAEVHP